MGGPVIHTNLSCSQQKTIDTKLDRNLSEFGNLPNLWLERADLREDKDLQINALGSRLSIGVVVIIDRQIIAIRVDRAHKITQITTNLIN
jgi:hypothetical protein